MRVNMVNPSNPLYARRSIPAGHRVSGLVTRRRSRPARGGGVLVIHHRGHGRRRRRNPLIMPNASANPLIMPNRGRRRRGRRNPFSNPRTAEGFLYTAGVGMLAGAASYYSNKHFIGSLGFKKDSSGQMVDTDNGIWLRNFTRLGIGGAAAYFFKGQVGAAINGAMSYPLWSEIDAWMDRNNDDTSSASSVRPSDADLTDADLDGLYG